MTFQRRFPQTILFLSLIGYGLTSYAQQTENVVLVTLDGVRWQEVFAGADSTLLFDPAYSADTAAARKQFWAATPIERRGKLMPFCWNTLAKHGQLYGNRLKNSRVNVANPYWFSYPGYNEMLTGFADERINSNDKKANPNTTVLEFLNKQPKLQNKVAVFSSWDVIEAVVNEGRSGIYINSASEPITGSLTGTDSLLNTMMRHLPSQSMAFGRIF